MTLGFSLEPSIQNTIYSPDQLIAGNFPVSTDTITLASGNNLVRGTLLGQQTASIYATAATAATSTGGANTGHGTIGTISAGAAVKFGTYRINMTSSTAFTVTDPAGIQIGTGTAGAAFTDAQVTLTVTAGGTAFVATDGFNLVVEEAAGSGAGLYVPATATATDGSQDPRNWVLLAEDTNTSSTGTNAATACPVYIAGEFDANMITLGAGLTAPGVKTALRQASSNIILKTGALSNAII